MFFDSSYLFISFYAFSHSFPLTHSAHKYVLLFILSFTFIFLFILPFYSTYWSFLSLFIFSYSFFSLIPLFLFLFVLFFWSYISISVASYSFYPPNLFDPSHYSHLYLLRGLKGLGIRNFMWHSIESSKYLPTIGTHMIWFNPRGSDKVFDSSVLYQISTLNWLFLVKYVFLRFVNSIIFCRNSIEN